MNFIRSLSSRSMAFGQLMPASQCRDASDVLLLFRQQFSSPFGILPYIASRTNLPTILVHHVLTLSVTNLPPYLGDSHRSYPRHLPLPSSAFSDWQTAGDYALSRFSDLHEVAPPQGDDSHHTVTLPALVLFKDLDFLSFSPSRAVLFGSIGGQDISTPLRHGCCSYFPFSLQQPHLFCRNVICSRSPSRGPHANMEEGSHAFGLPSTVVSPTHFSLLPDLFRGRDTYLSLRTPLQLPHHSFPSS